MAENVNIIFEGHKEILKVIKNHEPIIKYLGYPSEKCPLIGSKIKLGDVLGKGEYGTVFSITIPGHSERDYVVKKGELNLKIYNTKPSDLLDRAELYANYEFSWEELKPFQTEKAIKAYENNIDEKFEFVIPPSPCLLKEDEKFESIPKSKKRVVVKKGSYLCRDPFSEFVIGSYIGQLFREGKCINFLNTYSSFICSANESEEENKFYQYIFMDRVSGTLKKYRKCITNFTIIDAIFIQVLFAIACYQKTLQISHNDLHIENIFAEIVSSKTQFNGEFLENAEYYHYKIDDKDIYFPAIPLIIKIGDFGLAIKFSDPIVGDLNLFDGEEGLLDMLEKTEDIDRKPNKFYPSYDSLFFITGYMDIIDEKWSKKKLGPLISDSIMFMCDQEKKWKDKTNFFDVLTNNYVKKDEPYSPILNKLSDLRSAYDILKGPIIKFYGVKPNSKKIITLGKL